MIKGKKQFEANLRRAAARLPRVAGNALEVEAELIMTDSKTKYVPVDLGTLRNSGHVAPADVKPGSVSVAMGFGGPAAPYAEAIHEHPSGASPPSWKGKSLNFGTGGRKFLERPLMAARSGLGARLARRINVRDLA